MTQMDADEQPMPVGGVSICEICVICGFYLENAGEGLGGAADDEGGAEDGGEGVADGHALAVLATGADVEVVQVRANAGETLQHLGATAAEGGVLHGVFGLAVLYPVALGHLEHEVAGDRVHLARSEEHTSE